MAVALAKKSKPVVIDPEKSLDSKKLTNPEHFIFTIKVREQDKDRDAFLVLKASTLNQFADTVIQQSLDTGNLRVLFVLDVNNTDRFFDKVQELGIPSLVKKLFRVIEVGQIDRILHAWWRKRAVNTLASAYVDQEQDELVVQACDLEFYRVKFKDFPGLAELTPHERPKFEIDEWGHAVRWPEHNVAIDLDVIRYKVDDDFRKSKNMAALFDYQEFLTQAIEAVMAEHGLNQTTLKMKGGPAPRHLFRILQEGQKLTPNMLEKLAKAHGLEPKEYVEELIDACNDIVEEAADAIEEDEKGGPKKGK